VRAQTPVVAISGRGGQYVSAACKIWCGFVLLLVPLMAGAGPTIDVQWLERDADKVGKPPDEARPDGVPDHHFRITLQFPVEDEVLEIELRQESTVTPTTLRWNSIDASADYLAVERDGRRLNDPRASLGVYSGKVVFDVYAHDIGQWEVHRTLVTTVQVPEGPELMHVAALAPPPDRLGGLWRMHCRSDSPDAFEPMTMSGRILMVVDADRRVSGFFGSAPLTGALAADGRISGRAENADEQVEWQGKLDHYRSGATLLGQGEFRLLRSREACVGEGTWSNR
jgi:hypothetical protein